MDRELIDAFILECKQEQEWKERWKANHIEFDDYFKYSGEIEPDTPAYAQYLSIKDYDHRLISKPADRMRVRDIYLLLSTEEKTIVDIFYKYSNEINMEKMAKKSARSKDFFKKIITKHLKIMRDDKNNAARGLPRPKKFKW